MFQSITLVMFLFYMTTSGFALSLDSENEVLVLRKLVEELSTKVQALEEVVTADSEAVSRSKKMAEFQKSPSWFQGKSTMNFVI